MGSTGCGALAGCRLAATLSAALTLCIAGHCLAETAARGTQSQALFALALALEHGNGAPRDPVSAADLYCQAAREGHLMAQWNLAWMYANGRGLKRDDGVAAFFFELAAAQGDARAERMRRQISAPAAEPPACMQLPARVVVQADAPLPSTELAAAGVVTGAGDVGLGLPRTQVRGNAAASVPAERQWVVSLVHRHAARYGIEPELALAVIAVESNFNPWARSPKEAMGLMQLIPETAGRFRVLNPFDPTENIRGGLAYLRWLLAYYQGRVELVLAAYNAGEGRVDRFVGVPPISETREYVRRARELFPNETHPYDADVAAPSPAFTTRRAVSATR